MEKITNFLVFKEKIIKTDELLSVLLEKNKALDKFQKWNHQLKTKLELNKNEVNKLKLKNETLQQNILSVEKNYESLKVEHDDLKEQHSQLQSETNNVINNLQINYQLANQELKECEEKLATFEKQGLGDTIQNHNSPVKTKKSPVRKKKQPTRKKDIFPEHENDVILKEKNFKLSIENEQLQRENDKLKLDADDLRKQLSEVPSLEETNARAKEIEVQLKLKEGELNELKNRFDVNVKTGEQEIQKFTKKIKKLEEKLCELQTENEKLRDKNSAYQVEISMLLENNSCQSGKETEETEELDVPKGQDQPIMTDTIQETSATLNIQGRENNQTPSDEEVSAILKQMTVPVQVSPLRSLPELDMDNRSLSPFVQNGDIDVPPNPKINTRTASPINPDPKSIVTRRRVLKNNRRLLAKRKRRRIDLFGALLALKKANINFIISSDSLIPSKSNSGSQFEIRPHPMYKKPVDNKKKTTLTKELKCTVACCNNSYMLLKESAFDEDCPLLGFVEVKNETCVTDYDNHNVQVPACGECHRQKTLVRSTDKLDSELQTIAKNTQHVTDSCSKRENVLKNSGRTYKRVAPKRTSVENVNNIGELISNKTSTKQLQIETKTIRKCRQPVVQKNIEIESVQEDMENERDEGYSSYRRENSPIIDVPDQSPIRRSKRKSNIANLRIKKTKVATNNSKVGRGKCAISNLDMFNEDEYSLQQKISENQCKLPVDTSELVSNKHILQVKSPKTSFKRPVCSTRRSLRLVTMKEQLNSCTTHENLQTENANESLESPRSPSPAPLDNPRSPSPCQESNTENHPVVIPLDRAPEKVEKMPTTKIEVLFNKLIIYSAEESALNEVVREFSFQEPEYIAEAILERVAVDIHDTPDTKYNPAPLMTDVQRTMLGFMSKLEKTNVIGVFDHYLNLAEQRILTCKELHEFGPVTRLYLAICKLKKNLTRMRKLCCDVFYFCGDFAVPFLFLVLTSWTEVLPHEADSKGMPIARVLVQIVLTRDCNKPGYNLLPLRDLLNKFYGYPTERWDDNEFFKELFYEYLRNPIRSSDFALILYCKSRPEKWMYEKIEEHIKPIVNQKIADNFKATIIILLGNLYNRFSSKSEINYLPKIREWFSSLVTETTPDVVKRSVYLCLNRLKKK